MRSLGSEQAMVRTTIRGKSKRVMDHFLIFPVIELASESFSRGQTTSPARGFRREPLLPDAFGRSRKVISKPLTEDPDGRAFSLVLAPSCR
jgi:hypothetical protein